MFQRVIIGIDGSERSWKAGLRAHEMGLLKGAQVELVAAFDDARLTYGGLLSLSREQSDQLKESLRSKVLEPARAALAAKGLEAETLMVEGAASEALCEHARHHHADLIIVGRRGMGAIERMLVGSVSLSLVRRAPCPVLIVPKSAGVGHLSRLLAPTDFSEAARIGAKAAFQLAAEVDAEAWLCHCLAGWDIFPGGDPDLPFFDEALRDLYSELRARLDTELDEVSARNQRGRTLLLDGEPSDGLLRAAADTKAQLIALASHGRRGLNRWLVGSTAERLIKHSPIPVLLWRAEA